MTWILGVDEAGYGPNLGPLVISASLWHADEPIRAADLYQRLAPAVADHPAPAGDRVVVADSKRLYQPGRGLATLECALWPALCWLGHRPRDWRDVWRALAPGSCDAVAADPCLAGYDEVVPLAAEADQLDRLGAVFGAAMQRAGVQLAGLASRVVLPAELNAALGREGTKATVLSRRSLALAAECVSPLGTGAIELVCDRHGGRRRYAELLSEFFPGALIEIYAEQADESVYRFGPPERRVEARFRVGAESFLPVALASVAAKYLRELAMRAFNAFWAREAPGVRPTAGYPADARRFKAEIAAAQRRLGIDDSVLWRAR